MRKSEVEKMTNVGLLDTPNHQQLAVGLLALVSRLMHTTTVTG